MLVHALKARIPLIGVSTTDTLNAVEIVAHYVGVDNVTRVSSGFNINSVRGAKTPYLVALHDDEVPLDELYFECQSRDRCVVLINVPEDTDSGAVFDAGEMPVPQDMIADTVEESVGVEISKADKAHGILDDYLDVMTGLTLKQISDVCRITMARESALSLEGVRRTRISLTKSIRGLMPVDTIMACYLPDPRVEAWIKRCKLPFLEPIDPQLTPRGLLFNGIPGVGKTSAAKHIAHMFEVPLYRLDTGVLFDKWQGESERHMGLILEQVDREEPCVFLIDEIEKALKDHDSNGTSSRLLGMLLWWLQEHKTKVLTLMTTNSLETLPKEVYRPGRIDQVMEVSPLTIRQSKALATKIYDSLQPAVKRRAKKTLVMPEVASTLQASYPDGNIPHTVVATTVYQLVTEKLAE